MPAVLTPTKVPILAAVREIGAGGVFSVAVTTKGKVLTWGNNGFGQLGDGTTVSRATPERLSTPSTPVSVLGFGEGGIDALF